jgi:hypothetical protein
MASHSRRRTDFEKPHPRVRYNHWMPPTINTDDISDEQKGTEKFKRAYQEMYAMLTAPGFAHVLACHEAAHLFYFTKAGTKNYDPFPARLYYDPAIDDYGGTLASVQPLDLQPPKTAEQVNEWVWTMLMAHAAGGVVARKLMPTLLDHGDEDDKIRFVSLCKRMNLSDDPEDLWKRAQDAVFKELVENPKVLAALEQFAEEDLRPQLGLGESRDKA